MNVKEAIVSRRSVRSFCNEYISAEILKEICETSRLYASGANRQPIRFGILNDKVICEAVFEHVRWAAYTPEYEVLPNCQPPAYILLLADIAVNSNPQYDAGAASTNIMLLAKEKGLDTCCIGSFSREHIVEILGIDTERYQPLYLIAIGKSEQKNEIKDMEDTVKYTFEEGRFIVPKHNAEDIYF